MKISYCPYLIPAASLIAFVSLALVKNLYFRSDPILFDALEMSQGVVLVPTLIFMYVRARAADRSHQ